VPPASEARPGPRALATAPVLVGESERAREIRALVERVASSPVRTVLLTGESGVGKGIVARAIHFAGPDATKAFVTVTCSALPEGLVDADFLELRDGGTLFLDEISEMSPALQAKVLRFMDDEANAPRRIRVIAATHDDMEQLVAEGRFRRDLYYRLRGFPVHLPPLRERKDDIEPLTLHFLAELGVNFGKHVVQIGKEARAELLGHDWRGNVRELKQCIERALLLADGDSLNHVDCGTSEKGSGEYLLRLPREGLVLADLEKSLVHQALEATRWNQVRAARLLGLNRDQVRYRIEKFGLTAPTAADDGRAA
jgi:DNA-binding NtrC family response regulator